MMFNIPALIVFFICFLFALNANAQSSSYPFTVKYGVCTVALPLNISTTVTLPRQFIWPVPTARTLVGPCSLGGNATSTCTTVVPVHLKTVMPSGIKSLPPNFTWPPKSLRSCFPPHLTVTKTVALREHTVTSTATETTLTTETEVFLSSTILSTATETTTQSLLTTTLTKSVLVTLAPVKKMCTSFIL